MLKVILIGFHIVSTGLFLSSRFHLSYTSVLALFHQASDYILPYTTVLWSYILIVDVGTNELVSLIFCYSYLNLKF